MTRRADFWTWQLDRAAEQSKTRTLCVATLGVYLLGALVLIVQPRLGLTLRWAEAGTAMVMLAMLGSAAICARVVLARTRHS